MVLMHAKFTNEYKCFCICIHTPKLVFVQPVSIRSHTTGRKAFACLSCDPSVNTLKQHHEGHGVIR